MFGFRPFRPSARLWRKGPGCRGLLVVALLVIGVMLPGPAAGASARASHGASKARASQACPWVTSTAPIGQRVAQLMSQMTVPQGDLLGRGPRHHERGTQSLAQSVCVLDAGSVPGNPIAGLCIPKLGEEDGPNGVADQLVGVTQLPSGVSLAATWDQSLANQYGQVVGNEGSARAPT